jgi:hypothetical protein
MGFNMVTISTDLNILAKSLIEELNKIKWVINISYTLYRKFL